MTKIMIPNVLMAAMGLSALVAATDATAAGAARFPVQLAELEASAAIGEADCRPGGGRAPIGPLSGAEIGDDTIDGGAVGMALDVRTGKVYWSDDRAAAVRRSDLTGANVETVIAEVGSGGGFARDLSRGRTYRVGRERPTAIALDLATGVSYVAGLGARPAPPLDMIGTITETVGFEPAAAAGSSRCPVSAPRGDTARLLHDL